MQLEISASPSTTSQMYLTDKLSLLPNRDFKILQAELSMGQMAESSDFLSVS